MPLPELPGNPGFSGALSLLGGEEEVSSRRKAHVLGHREQLPLRLLMLDGYARAQKLASYQIQRYNSRK